jgi:hypothetical protein
MDKTQGEPSPRLSRTPYLWLPHFLLIACALILGGCASPGEPIERRPPVPQQISDLTAEQFGNSVTLSFAVPTETVDHRPLNQPLAIEIFRDFKSAPSSTAQGTVKAAASVRGPATLLLIIPPAMTASYIAQGRFRYVDALKLQDLSQYPNALVVYAVRTRASKKNESPASNVAALQIVPLPDPIDDLKAEATHSGIQLTWTPPTKTPVGPAPPIAIYRIYRTAAEPASASGSAVTSTPSAPLVKIAETQSPNDLDTQIQFGDTYTYSVRSIVRSEGQELESAASNPVTVAARVAFPPPAPQGLVVVLVPAQGSEPRHLELSWAISPETDLAGYNVYRTEQAGTQGTRLNSDLLPTPAFQDMNAVPGRTYFYSVTAVDRSGNESPASAALSGTVPAESQSAP